MRQRPSLFNYGTPVFHTRRDLFCERIDVADEVMAAEEPLFTELDPLPILGTPGPIGLDFCLQIRDAAIDLHPGSAFALPPELDPLGKQHFALHARACGGIDCPSQDVIDEVTPLVEQALLEQQTLAIGEVHEKDKKKKPQRPKPSPARAPVGGQLDPRPADPKHGRGLPTTLTPGKKLTCFCLDLFGVGHFEWGTVPGSTQSWLKTRLDGLEIVDLTPVPMETAIECYLSTVIRLGILPQLIVPTEKMTLDITESLAGIGLTLGKQVVLGPSAISPQLPNNPAVEDDQLKVFLDLVIKDLP